MNTRIKKTVCLGLTSAFMVSMLTGCDLDLSFGGKAKKQEELITDYIEACIDLDYDKAYKCVEGKKDSFQDVEFIDNQQEIVELCLARAEFEIAKLEDDEARITFKMPDPDKILRRENIEMLEMDEIEDLIDDSDKWFDEDFVFEFVQVDKEWYIKPKSTKEFAEFIEGVGDEIAPRIGVGSNIVGTLDQYIAYMAQGDYMAAVNLTDIGGYYSSVSDPTMDAYVALYSIIYSAIDYEAEVTDYDGETATIHVTGTRIDYIGSVVDAAANNEELTVPFLKDMVLLRTQSEAAGSSISDYDSDYFNEYYERYIEYVTACCSLGGTESFEADIEVEIESNGKITLGYYSLMELIASSSYNNEPVFNPDYYEQALNELLAAGLITQEQYEAYLAMGPDELMS